MRNRQKQTRSSRYVAKVRVPTPKPATPAVAVSVGTGGGGAGPTGNTFQWDEWEEVPAEDTLNAAPNQPRVPPGNSDGGQWVSAGGRNVIDKTVVTARAGKLAELYRSAPPRAKAFLDAALGNAGIHPDDDGPIPADADYADLGRTIARRVVSSWVEAHRLRESPETVGVMERALDAAAVRRVGREDETAVFDPTQFRSESALRDGQSVRVVRPALVYDDVKGLLMLAPGVVVPIASTLNYDPSQPRDDHGRWVDRVGGAGPLAVMEKYKGEQAWNEPIREYMESRGLTIDDYKAANALLYAHNVASGGSSERDLVNAWIDQGSLTGRALRAMADWQEWQLEHTSNPVPKLKWAAIEDRVAKAEGNWNAGRGFFQGGATAQTADRYRQLIAAQRNGEHVFYRKGDLTAQVISTTSDPKGAKSGSSHFAPDRFMTYDEMRANGFRLVSGARGVVGVTSAQEQEYIWIKDRPVLSANYDPRQPRDSKGRWVKVGTGAALSKYLGAKMTGPAAPTREWLDKVKALNPKGLGGDVVAVPAGTRGAKLDALKRLLPEGTVIVGRKTPTPNKFKYDQAEYQYAELAIDKTGRHPGNTHTSRDPTTLAYDKSSSGWTAENPYQATSHDEKVRATRPAPNAALPDATRPAPSSQRQADHINNYTWGYDKLMNRSLRETGAPPPGPYGGNASGKPDKDGPMMFADLQDLFARAKPFKPPVQVYRGIPVLSADKVELLREAAVGAMRSGRPVSVSGFQSSSTKFDAGSEFGGDVFFRIRAVHGLDVNPYSHFADEEDELLLNHGAQYMVTRVGKHPESGRLEIDMNQLPPRGHSKKANRL